jgi:hypothetical protein
MANSEDTTRSNSFIIVRLLKLIYLSFTFFVIAVDGRLISLVF